MPAAKTAKPKKDEATAALEEGSGQPRSVEVRGTEFTLPPEIPFEVLFASRTAHRAQRDQDYAAGASAMVELAVAYVGEDKFHAFVRGLSMKEGTEATKDLIDACNTVYGTDTGESSASSDS